MAYPGFFILPKKIGNGATVSPGWILEMPPSSPRSWRTKPATHR